LKSALFIFMMVKGLGISVNARFGPRNHVTSP
jgi:hypothetical protein